MKFSTQYQTAKKCVGGEQPGARALQDFLLLQLGQLDGCDTVDSGIYNCRKIRGSVTQYSTHAEGRAGDTGVRLPDGGWPTKEINEPGIRAWCDRLIDHAAEIGVTYVIYARQSRRPGQDWEPYRGTSPHFDHIHWEIRREAAEALTPDYVAEVFSATDGEYVMDTHTRAALATIAITQVYQDHGGRSPESAAAFGFHLDGYLSSADPVDYLVRLATGLENEQ